MGSTPACAPCVIVSAGTPGKLRTVSHSRFLRT